MNKLAAVLNYVSSFQLDTNTLPSAAHIAERFPEMPDLTDVIREGVQNEFLVTGNLSYAVTSGGLSYVRLLDTPALDPVKVKAAQESNEYAQRRMREQNELSANALSKLNNNELWALLDVKNAENKKFPRSIAAGNRIHEEILRIKYELQDRGFHIVI